MVKIDRIINIVERKRKKYFLVTDFPTFVDIFPYSYKNTIYIHIT